MSSYADTLRKHARITILRVLENAPQYESNVSLLTTTLKQVGINFTRDQVMTEVNWLEQQGFVKKNETGIGYVVIAATISGIEVAQGITTHDGIQRPAPEA